MKRIGSPFYVANIIVVGNCILVRKRTNSIRRSITSVRPPISGSRLHHYSKGGQLTFEYLNHRTGEKEMLTLAAEDLICRLIEHIPDKHFKMIRYYGFLSNRRRGEMLPKVYDALEMESKDAPALPCYASMLKKYAKVDPYECLFCRDRLEFVSFRAGESREELIRQTVLEGQLRSA